jgi:hypothetical protein
MSHLSSRYQSSVSHFITHTKDTFNVQDDVEHRGSHNLYLKLDDELSFVLIIET